MIEPSGAPLPRIGEGEALRPPAEMPVPRELVSAAQEFEALFIHLLMRSMRESIPRSELFGEDRTVRMYEDLRDEELANTMARHGGLGLARLLVEQLGKDEDAAQRLREASHALGAAERGYGIYGELQESGIAPGPPSEHSKER